MWDEPKTSRPKPEYFSSLVELEDTDPTSRASADDTTGGETLPTRVSQAKLKKRRILRKQSCPVEKLFSVYKIPSKLQQTAVDEILTTKQSHTRTEVSVAREKAQSTLAKKDPRKITFVSSMRNFATSKKN